MIHPRDTHMDRFHFIYSQHHEISLYIHVTDIHGVDLIWTIDVIAQHLTVATGVQSG